MIISELVHPFFEAWSRHHQVLDEKQTEEHRIIGHFVCECFLQLVSFFEEHVGIVIDLRENFEIKIGHHKVKKKQL